MRIGYSLVATTFITMILVVSAVAAREVRTWTNYRGSTMEGALVEVDGNFAIVEQPDGKRLRVPLDRLSREDQVYVRQSANPYAGQQSAAGDELTGPLADLLGTKLISSSGKKASTASLAHAEKVGLYFSAHWCPPCRAFTPKLVKAYRELQKEEKPFEVVFVSSDKDKRSMLDYMEEAHMPWLAVPYGSDAVKKLRDKFRVSGIPRLVIVDAEGKVLTPDARGGVTSKGAGAYDRW